MLEITEKEAALYSYSLTMWDVNFFKYLSAK